MTMPFIPILIAVRAEAEAAVADYSIGGKALTVRHHRHREARSDELGCVAIRFVSNDISQLGEQTTWNGQPEGLMELAINLVIDLPLPPEEDDPASLAGDPTGFGEHAAIVELILNRLLPDLEISEPNTLGGLAWQIRYDGSAPDEGDANPDAARMEERLAILYRVRADHPTVLLPES